MAKEVRYVLLQQHDDIRLVCETRYSHSLGWLDGREIRKDIPDPAPGSPIGFASEQARYPFAHNRDLLRRSVFVSPSPFVTAVIFIATPHRGSYLARGFVRRMLHGLVE